MKYKQCENVDFESQNFTNCWGPEVVWSSLYQEKLPQNLLTCIYLHCVRRLSWSATTLDTLRLTKIAFVFTWKFPQTRKLFINLREKLGWRKSSIPFGWANFRAWDKARYITNFCHNIDLTIGTPFGYKALPPLRYWCFSATLIEIF